MTATRRNVLTGGGGLLAALTLQPRATWSNEAVRITMHGTAGGSKVWFDPIGVRLQPGQTVEWVNHDPGNAHTATAYHPANFGRPLRIPEGAAPWNSDYLLPDETFTVTLTVPGVYDYYCVPHEHAGMVGRLVVGTPPAGGWPAPPLATGDGALPAVAMEACPAVEAIMRKGMVRRA
jgi:plastocyanin